ncbi:hypothetical protein GLOIN_2v1526590 [Rhizophagus irregularis DAOM 181602=DAOM 197198]|uniref:Uncharacterized protein n=1 Tax=Rhizophagus irregularis (strain DAOM 181602 / DAOM 197198 / MUCL 43194) TaxID=747089 RepID=A0A2P4QPL6_RHIID|nr:hypothetical protein GLOIN_2v1526590 [Rhizophagus irregularis DAOM 181602=DAOM 197198]POG79574.1 hypothetical protein GLOIN_2v1526590 [Rhizophagus irregularis DAOM 181602=DAOM 197198]|eukprot:XP_025186440.1 hypothetical protein GLOIN_2v1526590 [Rhizophagus irregularis DAOM 181602=DAOM 197198]
MYLLTTKIYTESNNFWEKFIMEQIYNYNVECVYLNLKVKSINFDYLVIWFFFQVFPSTKNGQLQEIFSRSFHKECD